MNMSIRLENVNYIYGEGSGQEKWALKNINLAIHDREFIGIVGHTGSGKSTLTQLLNGLEKPSSGTIYYNDEDIQADGYERRKLRQKVGLVFQYPEHQLFEVSVIKDVEFGPRNLGLSNLEVEKRSFDALKQVGLSDDLLDVAPFALSGGQKRRVAIAGVLAMQPEVLILDEPTAGLDPAGRTEILELLKKLHEENNITVILVSHSMDDVARYAGRILVMNQGELVLDGEPQKVFRYRDELRKIGLDVPQSTNILYELRDRGMAVGTEGITPEQAAECIADSLRRHDQRHYNRTVLSGQFPDPQTGSAPEGSRCTGLFDLAFLLPLCDRFSGGRLVFRAGAAPVEGAVSLCDQGSKADSVSADLYGGAESFVDAGRDNLEVWYPESDPRGNL